MIVTIEQAQASLAQIIAKAQAGEEVFIGHSLDHPVAKLVPLATHGSRLARHPDLAGSTATADPDALVKALPPEEWGGLADR